MSKLSKRKLRHILRRVIKENYDYDVRFDREKSQAWAMYQEMEEEGMDKDEIYNRLVARFSREVVNNIFGY